MKFIINYLRDIRLKGKHIYIKRLGLFKVVYLSHQKIQYKLNYQAFGLIICYSNKFFVPLSSWVYFFFFFFFPFLTASGAEELFRLLRSLLFSKFILLELISLGLDSSAACSTSLISTSSCNLNYYIVVLFTFDSISLYSSTSLLSL